MIELYTQNKMSSKSKQIFLIGLFMTVLGAILMIFNWYSALYTGQFYFQAAFLGPFAMIFGISATFFPQQMVPKTTNNSDVKPTKFTQVVLTLAMISGLINLVLLISGVVPLSK
jgi:predicted phage tail protein